MNRKARKDGAGAGPARLLERLSRRGAATTLFVAAVAVYWNSLDGKLVFDDTVIVQGNRSIQGLDLAHLKQIFGGHYWQAVESRGGLYRPVVMASYALNYAWGGEDPTGYHLVNVVLHAANSAMVFLLVEELFPGRALAFLCALLFALHPLRTEAVASIVGRAESLAAFFMLAAWLGYVRGRRRPGLTARLLPPVAFALAALTKESSLAFVALLPVTDFLMGKEPLRERFRPLTTLARYAPYLGSLALVVALRYAVLGGFAPLYISPSSNPAAGAPGPTRFLTATWVFARYLGLLVFPLRLSADYSYNAIPLVTTLGDPRVLVSIALLVMTGAGTVLSLRRAPFFFFCGAVFFAMFLGTSNWFRPIGTLMAERLLYFPSLGFTCALAYPLARGLAHKRWREPAAVAALALVLFYGWRTVARNRDWHDHYALFRSAVEAVPASSLAQANLAAVLLEERSDPRGAVEHARKALEIFPEDPAARYTLAQSYRRLGETELAAREFWEVARLAPRTSGAVAALRGAAEACESLGEPARAIAAYEKLLEWRPKDSAAREALARLNRQTAEASRK